MPYHDHSGGQKEDSRRITSRNTLEFEADDLRLKFYGPDWLMVKMPPILGEAMRILRAAKGPHVKSGTYHVVFAKEIPVAGKPGKFLMGCSYSPDGEDSDSWERTRKAWPPDLRALIPGPFIAISMSEVSLLVSRLGPDAMLVDLADTLHHEMIHLSTGVTHEGVDDLCLQDSEEFLKKAIELHRLDGRAEGVLLGAAALRRRIGHG